MNNPTNAAPATNPASRSNIPQRPRNAPLFSIRHLRDLELSKPGRDAIFAAHQKVIRLGSLLGSPFMPELPEVDGLEQDQNRLEQNPLREWLVGDTDQAWSAAERVLRAYTFLARERVAAGKAPVPSWKEYNDLDRLLHREAYRRPPRKAEPVEGMVGEPARIEQPEAPVPEGEARNEASETRAA